MLAAVQGTETFARISLWASSKALLAMSRIALGGDCTVVSAATAGGVVSISSSETATAVKIGIVMICKFELIMMMKSVIFDMCNM